MTLAVRYPEYVAVNRRFLKELPTGWGVSRLRYLCRIGTGTGDTINADPDGQFPFIVRSPDVLRAVTYDHDGEAILTVGDGAVGEVFHHITGRFLAHQRVYVLDGFQGVEPRFFFFYFSALFRFMARDGSARTTVDSVRRWMLTDLPVALPPEDEQRQIARFLDSETAQIDELIAEQQRLIVLLKERRQSLITRVAGRGLRSEVEFKESGLFWCSEVPAHWVVANIRKFATMKTGHTPSRTNPEYWVDCDTPWFTLADVWQLRDGKRTYLGETANNVSEVGLAHSSAELLPAGTVVLSRTASVGFSGVMPIPMATSQDFWNWIPMERLDATYLMWVFRAMRDEFASLMIGSTHKTIYQPTAAALRIPVPPMDEQLRIAAHLSEQTSKIDTLIAETERFIELSKERRSALITAAVTGQIDVRSVA